MKFFDSFFPKKTSSATPKTETISAFSMEEHTRLNEIKACERNIAQLKEELTPFEVTLAAKTPLTSEQKERFLRLNNSLNAWTANLYDLNNPEMSTEVMLDAIKNRPGTETKTSTRPKESGNGEALPGPGEMLRAAQKEPFLNTVPASETVLPQEEKPYFLTLGELSHIKKWAQKSASNESKTLLQEIKEYEELLQTEVKLSGELADLSDRKKTLDTKYANEIRHLIDEVELGRVEMVYAADKQTIARELGGLNLKIVLLETRIQNLTINVQHKIRKIEDDAKNALGNTWDNQNAPQYKGGR